MIGSVGQTTAHARLPCDRLKRMVEAEGADMGYAIAVTMRPPKR
jgi:hypothetical protein